MKRALVLGGGGPTGRAFELGVLKGLRNAEVDVTQADLVVGTSAGSALGAQIRAGQALDSLFDSLPAGPRSPVGASSGPGFDPAYFQQTIQMINGATEITPDFRIEIGKRALAATKAMSEDAQLGFIESDLGGVVRQWPNQALKVAAVDVADGSVRFFDSTQNVPIERAILASTALPGRVAPISVGDRRYVDGFLGGACPGGCWPNLEGADGYGVIVAIMSGSSLQVEHQTELMRSRGSQVITISPDADSVAAKGSDPFDITRLKPAAEAGLRQGGTLAADVRGAWNLSSPTSR